MPTLTFIEHNGTEHQVNADVGQSAMQAATFASVPGLPPTVAVPAPAPPAMPT